MKRYVITRYSHHSRTPLGVMTASSREHADGCFDALVKQIVRGMGDTVELIDLKNDSKVLRTHRDRTREERAEDVQKSFERLLDKLEIKANEVKTRVQRFADELTQCLTSETDWDVVRHFEWSREPMEEAAKLPVIREVLDLLRASKAQANAAAPRTVAEVLQYAREQVQRATRNPSWSTSPTSNMMHVFAAQAWAEMVEQLQWQVTMEQALIDETKEGA